jgi:hypothetical protein
MKGELEAAEKLRGENMIALAGSEKLRAESESMLKEIAEQRSQIAATATEVSRLVGQTNVVLALKKLKFDVHRVKSIRLSTRIDSPLAFDQSSASFEFQIALRDSAGRNVAEFRQNPEVPVREIRDGQLLSLRFEHWLFPLYEDQLLGGSISLLEQANTMDFIGEWYDTPRPGPPLADARREAITKFWQSIRNFEIRLIINDVPVPIGDGAPRPMATITEYTKQEPFRERLIARATMPELAQISHVYERVIIEADASANTNEQ